MDMSTPFVKINVLDGWSRFNVFNITKKKMKHLDLFSGYGGFTISAQKLGWETVGFSEVDKYAIQVLNYHFSNIKNYGDITKIKGEDLPTVDIITGGSPCQDLSVAGKGAGLDGARSGLFFHFIRLIKEKQPTYFVWENVKGALSSSKGWDFARVQIEMEQAGYDVQWQVINAKDFGVPQNRERIFAIGSRKGSEREILFEQRNGKQNLEQIIEGSQGYRVYDSEGIATTQAGEAGGVGAKTGLYAVRPSGDVDKRKYNLKDESGTLSSNPTSDNLPMIAIPNSNGNVHSLDANYWKGSNNPNKGRRSQIVVYDDYNSKVREDGNIGSITTNIGNKAPRNGTKLIENMRIKGRRTQIAVPISSGQARLVDPISISTTITAGWGETRNNACFIPDNMRIRRLTPLECERLMGLEDNWTNIGISDTQRYKLCGNGVVVNCVDYIFKLLSKE